MVVRKNRKLSFRYSDYSDSQVAEMLTAVDGKCRLLWFAYDICHLIESSFFRNIMLSDTNDPRYVCEMVVRYCHITDMVTVTYKETER